MNENERVTPLRCFAAVHAHTDEIELDRSAEAMLLSLSDAPVESGGRMLELSVRLKGVRPGKRVALGIALHELDECGAEYARGLRTVVIPAHHESGGCDVLVRGIRFVLPQELSLSPDESRRFVARTTAHYVDLDEAQACALGRRVD